MLLGLLRESPLEQLWASVSLFCLLLLILPKYLMKKGAVVSCWQLPLFLGVLDIFELPGSQLTRLKIHVFHTIQCVDNVLSKHMHVRIHESFFYESLYCVHNRIKYKYLLLESSIIPIYTKHYYYTTYAYILNVMFILGFIVYIFPCDCQRG